VLEQKRRMERGAETKLVESKEEKEREGKLIEEKEEDGRAIREGQLLRFRDMMVPEFLNAMRVNIEVGYRKRLVLILLIFCLMFKISDLGNNFSSTQVKVTVKWTHKGFLNGVILNMETIDWLDWPSVIWTLLYKHYLMESQLYYV